MKITNLLKPLLIMCIVICSYSYVNAAIIPMPIIINHGGYGYMTIKDILGLYIALNIPSILIIIIRSLIWRLRKPNWSYVEYVWYSDFNLMTPDINTMWLVILNGIFGVIGLGFWVSSIL